MIGALSRSQILRCVAAIASFILTGCAASETEDAGVLRIGMMPKLVGIDYFNASEKRAREAAAELGVELVELDELLKRADFVSVHCPLTDGTRDLIGSRELALMRSDAYLLNTARGGIVDEDALYDVLSNGAIAGAALDCYVGEPILEPSRFSELDNIILAPHSIAWTDEFFTAMGRMCCQTMVDLSLGREPSGIINPEVLDQPGFQAKWDRLKRAEG